MKNKLIQVISSIFLFSIVAVSCNQDDGSVVAPPIGGLSGYLLSTSYKMDSTYPLGGESEQQIANAQFYINPEDSVTLWVDSVSVNGYKIGEIGDPGGPYGYMESNVLWAGMDMNTTCNWQVYGNSTIPSFTYNYSTPYPTFTGILPDTIDKNNGSSFNLSFTNADSVAIFIWGDSTHINPKGGIYKTFPYNATTFTFSQSDLSAIVPSEFYGMRNLFAIHAFNHTTQTLGGKKFVFVKSYEYHCGVWIK